MEAIFKKCFSFVEWHNVAAGAGVTRPVPRLKHAVRAQPDPQVVPDWVAENKLFKAGVAEKSILITNAPKPEDSVIITKAEHAALIEAAKAGGSTVEVRIVTEVDVAFLQKRGYPVESVEVAAAKIGGMSSEDYASYSADKANPEESEKEEPDPQEPEVPNGGGKGAKKKASK